MLERNGFEIPVRRGSIESAPGNAGAHAGMPRCNWGLRGKPHRAASTTTVGIDDREMREPKAIGLPVHRSARWREWQRFAVDQPAERRFAAVGFERNLPAAPFNERAVRRIDDRETAGLRCRLRERAWIKPLQARR